MKKILFVAATIFVSIAMSAQSKGEMYIAGSLSASFGNQTTKSYNGTNTITQDGPLQSEVGFRAEFGYFASDNLRFALGMGVPYVSTPNSLSGDTWLKSKGIGFLISPNIAYYTRIADRLYYNPEIGYTFETGSYKQDLTTSTTYNAHYNGHVVYLQLLSLEFRASQKFAIGIGIGGLSYTYLKIKDKDSDSYVSNRQFKFDLNKANVHVSFYF